MGRTVREKFHKDDSESEVTVLMPNGIIVEARGQGVPAAQVKSALSGLDLARLEAVKAAPK